MREIKFRAWVKNNKVGHELFTVVMISWIGKEVILSGKGGSIGLDDCVLTQYTGLKDKNGKEIYEGDIIKRTDDSLRLVKWAKFGFQLYGTIFPDSYWDSDYLDWQQSEVIGNIYENKELLNG